MINVALCAYGMSGKVFHAPLIASENSMHLHTILQRSSHSAADDCQNVNIVDSFDAILEDEAIHLVVINTPNVLHFPMTKAALEAGKHVVVEKPFTLSIDEGKELIQLAEEKNLTLAVFQNKRLESDFIDAQNIIESGKLGRIVEVEWHYDRFRTHITHKRWKEDKLPGSGTWFDLGIHMLDSMLCLFGKPSAVNADMRSLRREAGSVDYFNVRFEYPDKRVILRSSTFVLEKGPNVTIHGDKGSFVKFGGDVQEEQLQNGILPGMKGWAKPQADNFSVVHTQINGNSFREVLPGMTGCYEHFYENVAAAIQTPNNRKDILQFTAQLPLLGVELLLLAEQSAEMGSTIYT